MPSAPGFQNLESKRGDKIERSKDWRNDLWNEDPKQSQSRGKKERKRSQPSHNKYDEESLPDHSEISGSIPSQSKCHDYSRC